MFGVAQWNPIDKIPSNRAERIGLAETLQQHEDETGGGEEVELSKCSAMISHHGLLKLQHTCDRLHLYDE